jgi:hypothetical protein
MMENKNDELRLAWDFVEHTGRSIFLTGKAGTGKTTFLKTVVEKSRKRSIVVAPTGVAAINAGGMTIHSFFQLSFSPYVPGAKVESKFDFSKEKRRIISSLDLLIIDEISMVRSDLLDAIDAVLRRFRDRYQPFGGVQLLMIGDLQQLTPVMTSEDERVLGGYYETPYFFGSRALQQTDYVTIQLEKVYRQQDDTFLTVLNHIRLGKPTADDLQRLNARVGVAPMGASYIRLTTHNHLADHYNDTELKRLTSPSYLFHAKVEGTFPEYSYPTAEQLELREGAQVMFIKNDTASEHRYYNGRIGTVAYVDDHRVQVLCEGDAEAIEVEPMVWENARYTLNAETRDIQTEVLGTFRQLPLRLAWAITIHKSQGLTFDHAIIDANLSFAPGQVYVALSRCRTLKGLVLAAPIEARSIKTDKRVDDYIIHQEEATRQSLDQLPQLKDEYYRHLLLELFDFRSLLYQQEYMARLFSEFFYNSHNSLTQLHKQVLDQLKQQVMEVAAKWTQRISQMTIEQLHSDSFLERVENSATYFAETLESLFTKPIQLTADVKPTNKLAAKRLASAYPDLRQTWLSRRYLLLKMAEEGFSIASYLCEKQMSQLDALDETTVKKTRKKKIKKEKPPKEVKPKTWEVSWKLYQSGLLPDAIAKERCLTLGTVFGHLSRYVDQGLIPLDELVSPEKQQAIRSVIDKVGKVKSTSEIKVLCPPEVTYEEIRMLLSANQSK